MANLGILLGSFFLIGFGAIAMEVYSASFGFVVGLFTMMGGVFLFPVALTFGPPPRAVTRPELEAEARGLLENDSSSRP